MEIIKRHQGKVKKGCTIKISIQDKSQSYTTFPRRPRL